METQSVTDPQLTLTVADLATFATQGQLPQSVLSYRQANDNQLPPQLYVPLGVIINNDMAAQERAASMGKPLDARPADDYRQVLYTQDPIMQELLEPFRQQRQQLQQTPLSEAEHQGLSRGQLPMSITGYLNDHQGELPTNAIKPVSEAVVDTTLARRGEMYPQFEVLYTHSIELPQLVDEPIRQGLKDQGLLPADSQDWRTDIARNRSGSEATLLGIAEGIQTQEMSVLLPAHAAELRTFLRGDNYLSNEEISKAIFDENTTRDQMRELVRKMDTTKNPDVQERVTDYLLELKDNTRQFPALLQQGPGASMDMIHLIQVARAHQTGEQPPVPPPPGEVVKNIGLIERIKQAFAVSETRPETGQSALTEVIKGQPGPLPSQGTTVELPSPLTEETKNPTVTPKSRKDEHESTGGLLTKLLQVKLMSGGMASNFLHNYQVVQDLMNKLLKPETYGFRPKEPTTQETKPLDGVSRHNQLVLNELLREFEQRTRPTPNGQTYQPVQEPRSRQTTPAGVADLPAQKQAAVPGVSGTLPPVAPSQQPAQEVKQTARTEVSRELPVPTKSIVSRLMDHFLDKLAGKLLDRIATRQQPDPRVLAVPLPGGAIEHGAATQQAQPVGQRTQIPLKPVAVNQTASPTQSNLGQPSVATGATIPETFRQQEAYVLQEKRFTWEQIKPQMDKLGISERAISPMNKALLLDGHATHPDVTLTIKDRHGITAPAQGRLVLIEIPGRGPQVHIEPPQLKTTLPIPPGLQLFREDIMRLQKTGMANRPVTLTDPESNARREVLVGYDPVLKKLHTVDKEMIKVPAQIKGQLLSETQQEQLRSGKQITLTGLTGSDQKPYAATVQFSAVDKQFRMDRIGKKQTETIAQSKTPDQNVKRADKEGFVVYLKALTPENNQKWQNSQVEVQTPDNKVQFKKVRDLTYSDSILVGTNGVQKSYVPLTMKPQDNVLLSPSEQARLLQKIEKNPPIGSLVIQEAKPHELEKAKTKYQSLTQTDTSVVSKNGSSRITQNQTGSQQPKPSSGQPGNRQENQRQTPTDSPKPAPKPAPGQRPR